MRVCCADWLTGLAIEKLCDRSGTSQYRLPVGAEGQDSNVGRVFHRRPDRLAGADVIKSNGLVTGDQYRGAVGTEETIRDRRFQVDRLADRCACLDGPSMNDPSLVASE